MQSKGNKPIIVSSTTVTQQEEKNPVESLKKKSSVFKILLIAGTLIIVGGSFFIWKKFSDEKQQSINLEKQRVEQIINEVNQAITAQNYDLAFSTLNNINWQLNPDANSQYVEQYNIQRENLRKILLPLKSQDSIKKVEIALQLSTDQIKQDSIQKADTLITSQLTLISGGCSNDGCTLVFKNKEGSEMVSTQFPDKIIQFDNDEDSGGALVNSKYLNKKYSITYKLKNVHHEESNSDDIEMVIEEMKMIK